MAIFNSYVSSPKGIWFMSVWNKFQQKLPTLRDKCGVPGLLLLGRCWCWRFRLLRFFVFGVFLGVLSHTQITSQDRRECIHSWLSTAQSLSRAQLLLNFPDLRGWPAKKSGSWCFSMTNMADMTGLLVDSPWALKLLQEKKRQILLWKGELNWK